MAFIYCQFTLIIIIIIIIMNVFMGTMFSFHQYKVISQAKHDTLDIQAFLCSPLSSSLIFSLCCFFLASLSVCGSGGFDNRHHGHAAPHVSLGVPAARGGGCHLLRHLLPH